MRGSSRGNKRVSVFYKELSEIAESYGSSAETLIEIYETCWEHDVDYQWSQLCSLNPDLKEASQYDRERILDLLSRIRGGQKKSKEEVIRTSKVETDGKLYEEIYRDGQALFIDPEGNTYEELEIGGLKYAPISGDELTEGAVLLPSGLESYEDEKTLIAEIQAHIHKYVDVSPFFETISAYYILLSWLYDRVNTLPYLRVLGDTGTGKSRFLDTVGRLCYKATIVSGAITPAPIYRLIRKWQGTIIIDEGDFRASDEKNEVVKILNCGFERGRPVVRSQKDHPDSIQILPTFSPKIIASRKRFDDVALESRCLTEIMQETDRDIPYLLPTKFYEEEQRLRNKLLAFRFRNHGRVDLENAQKLADLDVENRLKQAMSSFIVLFANNEKLYNEFTAFLINYNRELVEQRSETYEGAIVQVIFDLVTEYQENVPNVQNVQNVQLGNEDLAGLKITAADIADRLREKYGMQEVTARSVGRRIRTLGMTTRLERRGGERKRYLNLDVRQLTKLIKKYIPDAFEEKKQRDILDIKDINTGLNAENVQFMTTPIEGKCERCGRETWLDHEWIDEDGEVRYICPECAAELKEELKESG